jgi:hypothetical protein
MNSSEAVREEILKETLMMDTNRKNLYLAELALAKSVLEHKKILLSIKDLN